LGTWKPAVSVGWCISFTTKHCRIKKEGVKPTAYTGNMKIKTGKGGFLPGLDPGKRVVTFFLYFKL
jgi:hypothetical protein